MNKRIFSIILLLGTFLTGLHGQNAVFVYAVSGDDGNNGLSWGSAKKTIAAGIAAAGSNGTVYVKAGRYNISGQLDLSNGVTVKGGYSVTSTGTDTNQRHLPNNNGFWENDVYCSIIQGSGNHRIATVGSGCTLEGCVLTNGYTTGQGAGVYLDGGTVRYCVIKDCIAINEETLAGAGGGVYMCNNALLSNSIITTCKADNGPAVAGGNSTLINNTITRNWPTQCGTVRDYDGNLYQTVVLGQQCWTRSNLRTTHFADGTPIARGNSASETTPYYYMDYSAPIPVSTFPRYGYLYNRAAAMHGQPGSNLNPSGVQGICPNGWHLPSSNEWEELRNFVNTCPDYVCHNYDWSIAKALCSTDGWNSFNGTCEVGQNSSSNNATRFDAIPAGYWLSGFSGFGTSTLFWSTSNNGSNSVTTIRFDYNSGVMTIENQIPTHGFSIRCVKNIANRIPDVRIQNIHFSENGVQVNSICADGGGTISQRGICWSTSPNPTIADAHTTDGSGSGPFSSTVTGLPAGTTYYVRAYATNIAGTAYSEVVSSACPPLYDIDGNRYETRLIGSQCWSTENLRATRLKDGGSMTFTTSNSTSNAHYYAIDGNAGNTYSGYFYNYAAALNVCPIGWHLPTAAEFDQLCNYVKNMEGNPCPGNAGKALAHNSMWNSSSSSCAIGNNLSTNNCSGFSAKPYGHYDNGTFYDLNNYAWFWVNGSPREYRKLLSGSSGVESGTNSNDAYKHSIRCIKD